jgi:uncharacterized protein
MHRRKFLKLGIWGGTCALIASYPIFIERYMIQVNTYNIPVANLPDEFQGFRIVHLADLHYGFLVPELLINYVVGKANSLEGDIIVCTGDYVHERNSTNQIDHVWPILSNLKARYGVYSVLGNHDHWSDSRRSLFWLNESGQSIRHIAKPIEKNGKKIWIGGAGDLWEDDIGIDRAFANIPVDDCKIVLAHNPDTIDESFNTRIDFMISGHTHGGQVNIPFYGTPLLPVKNKRYASGIIETKKAKIFISRGIGWAILPIRFNCSPEIAILQLQKKSHC